MPNYLLPKTELREVENRNRAYLRNDANRQRIVNLTIPASALSAGNIVTDGTDTVTDGSGNVVTD